MIHNYTPNNYIIDVIIGVDDLVSEIYNLPGI